MQESALFDLFNLFRNAGVSLSGTLTTLGLQVAGVAILISGSWMLLKGALAGNVTAALTELFTLMVVGAATIGVLAAWPHVVSGAASATDDVVLQVSGSANATTGAITMLMKATDSMHAVLSNPPPSKPQVATNVPWWKQAYNAVAEQVQTTLDAFSNIGVWISVFVYGSIFVFVSGLLISLIIAIQIIGEVMFAIAAALGPILLALSLLPTFDFLRSNLIGFALNAAILKVLGVVLAGLISSVVTSLFAGLTFVDYLGVIAASIISIISLGVMIYVAIQAQSMAQALSASGGISAPGGSLRRMALSGFSGRAAKPGGGGGGGSGGKSGGGSGGGGAGRKG